MGPSFTRKRLCGCVSPYIYLCQLASCEDAERSNHRLLPSAVNEMAQVTEPLVLANSKFSIDLLKALCKDNTENVLFSPLSISSALGLVLLGAKNETADQLKKCVSLKTLQFDNMRTLYHDLYEELYKGGKNRSLQLVNRMFGESTSHFNDDFLDMCEEWCFASVRNVDFKTNPDAAREHINNWVEKKTGERIKNLLAQGDVSMDTSLALISAVCFTDKLWDKPFTPVNKDKRANWRMMYQTNTFPLGNIPHRQEQLPTEARILEIPYADEDLSMLIILPKESDGLQKLVESITYEKLLEWTEPDNMIPTDVAVEIPFFTMQEKYDLEKVLETLGIIDVFDVKKCDLSGMAPGPLKLSKVVHKSFVEVNEKGIDAGGGCSGVVQESFVADHPFLFFIQHNPTKSIIFWSRFIDP